MHGGPKQDDIHGSQLDLLFVLAVGDAQTVLQDLPRVDGNVRKVSACDLLPHKVTAVLRQLHRVLQPVHHVISRPTKHYNKNNW